MVRKLICCSRIALLLVGLVAAGCGPEELPYTDNSQDPLAYARDVRILVTTSAKAARRSREPADHLSGIASELKQMDRPRGDFGKIYEQIGAEVEQLLADCQRVGGRPPDLEKKLDHILELIRELPGEINPSSKKLD